MEWLIAAGLHPRANATTLTVARDLGARMDYDTGHARYCMEETAARVGIDVSNIKRHVSYLRELGALAWVVHGTRANIRRKLGLGGYAGTATVYAAVIPAVYDRAMGHRIDGTGYNARAIIDQRGRTPEPVDNPPVDNPGSESCAPPSLTVVKEVGQVQVESGFNYTSRKRASRDTASRPHQTDQKRSSSQGDASRRHPLQVARDIQIARRVRALVNWTQTERLRRLAYVLRPFIDRGLDSHDIAAELAGMCLGWRPAQPANYIRAALADQAAREAVLAADAERLAGQTWRAASAQQAADLASLAALFGIGPDTDVPARTDDDRRAAQMDWNIWPEVAAHYADDPDDAIDLYGEDLVTFAVRQDARINGHREMAHV
ncbi:cell wall protein [Streptomyces sp. NPDC005407]|uniref:cell wall protein n=1 Tax=Streptomyces sp. NPDC005407 TaxID=3155340 RepID=UPI0033BCC903